MQARTYIQSFLAVCARKRGNEWQAGPPDVCVCVCVFSASYLNHVYVASKYVRPSGCRGEKTTPSPFLGNTCHQMCDRVLAPMGPNSNHARTQKVSIRVKFTCQDMAPLKAHTAEYSVVITPATF